MMLTPISALSFILSGTSTLELAAIDQLLSDEKLLKLLEADLSQRYPNTTQTGRNSTPVEVIVRMLVLKH
jgi:IS5 family transposase